METMQWMTLALFTVTILVVISNKIDNALAALVGVAVMVWAGVMTEVDAFQYVDWNVMAILVSIWTIAGYFGKTGVPSWLALKSMHLSGGRPGVLVIMITFLSGVISMFVDNVVVVLMMAPVAISLSRALKIPFVPFILMIGFGANFMGTALLLGDLPPQMLHSVSGVEFGDFLWHQGRPSSFPILMVAFFATLGAMYAYGFRASKTAAAPASLGDVGLNSHIPNPLFATVVLVWFLLTIVGMAFRQVLDVKLGFIALTGAISLILVLELLGERVKEAPKFEQIIQELDWRAIFFYIALFSLVGGLEKAKILELLASTLTPIFKENLALGATLLYWVSLPIVGLVEHDAYILTFLYTIRDLGKEGVATWPLYWMLVWSGTLGSNLTIAGAPTLFVALGFGEKEEKRKVSLWEFLSWSVPFTLVASGVTYVLGMLIWVLPYMK